MIVITIVVIISFIWFYDPTLRRGGRPGSEYVARVYDHAISTSDYQRGVRRFELCRDLGLSELVSNLVTDAKSMDQAHRNFLINHAVLRHECDALGIVPTEEEVVAEIKAMPAFETNGVYDPNKYNMIVQNVASRGFTAQQIQEGVEDELRLKRLKELIGTTITAPTSEAHTAFEKRNQKTDLSFVRLKDDDLAKEVAVSDEDIKKAFDERKPQTDEMRKVKFVSFLLTDEQKKVQGRDRGTALQKLVDQAGEFAVAMTAKDAKFDEVAQKSGATIAETPEFALNDPPKELNESEDAAKAAFTALTLEQPNSDVIRTEFGYYVLQLTGITPARALTLDEAKPKLADALKKERVAEVAGLKAVEIRTKIDGELKGGKTFAEAATAAGATAEIFPTFSFTPMPKLDQPGAQQMVFASLNLEPGQLSEVLPIENGRIICRVEKRHPIDEAAFEKEKPMLLERLSQGLRNSAFEIWLAERRKLANIQGAGFGGG